MGAGGLPPESTAEMAGSEPGLSLRRIKNQIPKTMSDRATTPPTTPPAIAATGVVDAAGATVAVEVTVVVPWPGRIAVGEVVVVLADCLEPLLVLVVEKMKGLKYTLSTPAATAQPSSV